MTRRTGQSATAGALNKLAGNAYSDRIEAIREITNMFRLERMVYLVIIATSLTMLLVAAAIALYKGQFDGTQKLVTGGSGGVCAAASTGLLFMWNRALNLAFKINPEMMKRDNGQQDGGRAK